jgi:hypothetical protein
MQLSWLRGALHGLIVFFFGLKNGKKWLKFCKVSMVSILKMGKVEDVVREKK